MGRNTKYSLGLYEKAIPNGFSFEEMLSIAYICDFDRLEISIDESDMRLSRLDWSVAEQRRLLSISKDSGIPIHTMCLSGHRKYPLGSHDAAVRERSMDIMKKAIDFAGETGIKLIQLAGYDVYYEEHDERTQALFEENLALAVEYAAKCGIAMGFETMETPFMDTVAKAMKYVSEIKSAWLGVYPDIGNLQNASVLYGHDVLDDLQTGSGHIFAVHIKETVPGVYRDMRFGSGHTRYDDCLKLAVQQKVHMYTGEFWYQKGQDYLEEIRRSSAFLREKLDRAFLCE